MPRYVDHALRRREITDALLDIVAESGLASATIRRVADHSGWSTGVISHYFANRDDLLKAGLERATELFAEQNLSIVKTMTGLQAVEQLIEATLPLDAHRLALARIFNFFHTKCMTDASLREEMARALSGWRRLVAQVIRNAQTSGDLPADLDAHAVAADLLGMVDGLVLHALVDAEVMTRLREQSPIRFWISRIANRSDTGTQRRLQPRIRNVSK